MGGEFILEETLGEGAFGKVYLVTAEEDKKQYAMKVIDLRTSPEDEKDLAVKEANLLEQLQHRHILSYTDSFESNGAFCIVTEYCAKGDLSQYLAKQNGKKLEENFLKEWFRQISSALKYLHGKTIIHRDVKTPNIFLTEALETKLGDMGLAKVLERPSAKAVTFCGSPYYMSPEIFSAKPYDIKSDIWALGVIVYEMATLERPFDAMLMHQLVSKIIHGGLPKMPDGYSSGLNELLTKMMQKDPDKRPSAEEILNHGYFQGVKPAVLPKPRKSVGDSEDFGKSERWDGIIQKSQKGKGKPLRKGPFEVKELLGTLSRVRAEKEKKRQNLEGSISSETVVGIKTILANTHIEDKEPKQPVRKMKKNVMPDAWAKTVAERQANDTGSDADMAASNASVSDVNMTFIDKEDFSRTLIGIQSKTATDAFDLMCTVVSMITQDLPEDQAKRKESMKAHDDQMTKIIIQIEHLQKYIIRVLKEDMDIFAAVEELLGRIKDEDELEMKLIELIGKEKYDHCGIQLLFWRNFEHNLKKLQDKQRFK